MLNVINRRFRTSFIAILSLALMLALLISAVSFHSYTDKGLGENYGQKIYAIAGLKTTLVRDTLLIFIPPAVIALIFIIIAGILYSHRIAGPLVRIKAVARRISEGDLDLLVEFRKKDAIAPLADALNNMASKYRERFSALGRILDEMSGDAEEMRRAVERGDAAAAEAKRNDLVKKAEEINNMLSGIRL
ncbi:MAG: methyl-accepting chemotaxis protein [Nitrospiraceae bacterium]|nr:MAG: methyl-accepting chemotaxis protein [Nitrospiraceae bacterium]